MRLYISEGGSKIAFLSPQPAGLCLNVEGLESGGVPENAWTSKGASKFHLLQPIIRTARVRGIRSSKLGPGSDSVMKISSHDKRVGSGDLPSLPANYSAYQQAGDVNAKILKLQGKKLSET